MPSLNDFRVLLPNNPPLQVVSSEAPKMATGQVQPLMTKLVSVPQPIQFLPTQTLAAAPKEKPVLAPVVPLQPMAPLMQVDPPKEPEAQVEDAKDEEGDAALEAADEEESAADERSPEKLKAMVKPQVLTHVIEGFVIQEGEISDRLFKIGSILFEGLF